MICNYDYAQVVNVEKADKQIRQVYPSKSFFKISGERLYSQIFNRCRLFSKYSPHQQTQAGCYLPLRSLSPSFHCVAGEHLSSVCWQGDLNEQRRPWHVTSFRLLILRLIIYPMIPCRFDRVYGSDGVTRSHSSLNLWKPIKFVEFNWIKFVEAHDGVFFIYDGQCHSFRNFSNTGVHTRTWNLHFFGLGVAW
jgi:hypothetical protein